MFGTSCFYQFAYHFSLLLVQMFLPRPLTVAVCLNASVKRVIDKRRAFCSLMIVIGYQGKAPIDQVQTPSCRMIVHFAFYVRRLHDEGHFRQGVIERQSLANQCRKRAKTVRIFMRVSCAGNIEASRVGFQLDRCDLVRWHKGELCFGIEKAPDEPAGCCVVNSNLLACDPLHDDAFFAQLAYLSSTVAAKTSVPRMPIIPAAIKGTSGLIFQSSPPITAAGVIDRLRTR